MCCLTTHVLWTVQLSYTCRAPLAILPWASLILAALLQILARKSLRGMLLLADPAIRQRSITTCITPAFSIEGFLTVATIIIAIRVVDSIQGCVTLFAHNTLSHSCVFEVLRPHQAPRALRTCHPTPDPLLYA
jgi:hypothetical protein